MSDQSYDLKYANKFQVDDEIGFIKFFRGLPVKDDETIRIFDRGDYYTAHGDDAAFIARTVGLQRWNLSLANIPEGLQDNVRPSPARQTGYRSSLRYHEHHRVSYLSQRGSFSAWNENRDMGNIGQNAMESHKASFAGKLTRH